MNQDKLKQSIKYTTDLIDELPNTAYSSYIWDLEALKEAAEKLLVYESVKPEIKACIDAAQYANRGWAAPMKAKNELLKAGIID